MSLLEASGHRLADFIEENEEAIVSDWEDFARTSWSGDVPDRTELRDNASGMLAAVTVDMRKLQSAMEQRHRSEGTGAGNVMLDGAAQRHAKERIDSGFDVVQVVAEFRALRASVMRIWEESHPAPHAEQVRDLIRFNEAIDQLVAISVESYRARVEQGRRLYMGIISHDLRQPLCSVRLLVSALIRTGNTIESPPMLAKIQQSVESMDALVRDLVDLGNIRPGSKMTIYPQSLDLRELAGEVMLQTESANPMRSFTLETEGDLYGDWDGMRVRQMLKNLLGVAAQYGGEGATVALVVRPTADDDAVEMVVRTHGRRIPAEVLEMLFEGPLRERATGRSSAPGYLGLELYISREIVRAHQGEITAVSTAEGVTTFKAVLPKVGIGVGA